VTNFKLFKQKIKTTPREPNRGNPLYKRNS
jgi:hypothetical protein